MLATLGDDAETCIAAAMASVEHDLRPVPPTGAGRGEWEAALDERLRRLAVKVLPTAAPSQTAEWRKALIEALTDLPAMVALTAAKRAVHRPFRFVGDIEHELRAIAAELVDRREQRRRGLLRMRAEIERARNAPPALPAPDPDAPVPTTAIRVMSAEMRAIGLRLGALTEEQVAAALAEGDGAPTGLAAAMERAA